MMEVNQTYKIVVDTGVKTLTYTARVILIENNFVRFMDKFGKTFNYNLNSVISYEELKDG